MVVLGVNVQMWLCLVVSWWCAQCIRTDRGAVDRWTWLASQQTPERVHRISAMKWGWVYSLGAGLLLLNWMTNSLLLCHGRSRWNKWLRKVRIIEFLIAWCWICHCMTVIRMWLSIEQPLATEYETKYTGHRIYICTTQLNRESRSFQVAWCVSKVNSSVVCCKLCNLQVGSRQHHH